MEATVSAEADAVHAPTTAVLRNGCNCMVMKHCADCERLKIEYQRTISEIYAVVGGRFNTVREKLRELARWQDVRDDAVEALYKHKKTHAAPESSSVLRNVA